MSLTTAPARSPAVQMHCSARLVVAFLAWAILASASLVLAADWEHCKDVTSAFNVSSLAVTPDPIETGSPATFSLDTIHDIDVEDGVLDAKVHYFGVKVYHKSGPLCGPVACPMKPGNTKLDFTEEMPVFLPPGHITLTLHGKRDDDLDLFCVKILLKKKNPNGDKDESLMTQAGTTTLRIPSYASYLVPEFFSE